MALSSHYYQCLFCMLCASFLTSTWLYFSEYYGFYIVNLRYLIFTESKLLSNCSCPNIWASSHLMSWIDLPFLSGFWACSCPGIELHTASKSLFFPHPQCVLPLAWHCFKGHPITLYLELSTHFCCLCLIVAYLCTSPNWVEVFGFFHVI